jgi:hypothetical protein
MEPLTSAIGAAGSVRLAPGSIDIATLLKDGRVVAGEVLETFAGGSVVLGIGGQRVPAESHVDLQPGQRFLATVENTDGEVVLRLTPDDVDEASPLVRALRMVVGKELTIGSLLDGLRSLAGNESARSPALSALLADIASYAFTPDDGGEALLALVQRSGLRYESGLLAATEADHGSTWLRTAIASDIAARWAGLVPSTSDAGGPDLRSEITKLLLEALRAFVAAPGAAPGPAPGPAPGGASVAEVVDGLRRALAARSSDRSPARMLAVLERVAAQPEALPASADTTALLRWLFGAPADDRVRSLLEDVAKRALGRDLKARLLSTASELDDGPARERMQAALASIETDQLMNVARRHFDQPWHFSLPVPDAEQWVSAQFLHLPTSDRDAQRDETTGDSSTPSHRLMIGIEFSRLGPIRADLLLRERDLIVRLTVERPETAVLLRGLVESWREDFVIGGRAVHVAVTESPRVDVKLNAVAPDVRFLAENHLMDVSA